MINLSALSSEITPLVANANKAGFNLGVSWVCRNVVQILSNEKTSDLQKLAKIVAFCRKEMEDIENERKRNS